MSITHNLAASLSSFSLPVRSIWKLIMMPVTVKQPATYLPLYPKTLTINRNPVANPKRLYTSYGGGCTFFSLCFSSKLNPASRQVSRNIIEMLNSDSDFVLRIKHNVNPNKLKNPSVESSNSEGVQKGSKEQLQITII